MLNLSTGKPIAVINAPKTPIHGKTVYVSEKNSKNLFSNDKFDVIQNEFNKTIKGSPKIKLAKEKLLRMSFQSGIKPNDSELVRLYEKANELSGREILLKTGVMEPIMDPNADRTVVFVAGPSGSGKTTWVSKWCDRYVDEFPDNNMFMISRSTEEDPALEGLDIKTIELDENFVLDPIDPYELENSMVIFDDADTIPDKKIQEAVYKLKNDLLETGRKAHISLCVVSHLLNDNKKTKIILNECTMMTIFPTSGSAYQIKYCLKNYFGLDTKDIQRIMKLNSRWVTIHKNYPQLVIYEKGIYIISGQ